MADVSHLSGLTKLSRLAINREITNLELVSTLINLTDVDFSGNKSLADIPAHPLVTPGTLRKTQSHSAQPSRILRAQPLFTPRIP